MKKTTLLLAIFLFFSACTWGGSTKESQVTLLDGQPFHLESAIAGKPAILNFWASWCAFCATELPFFQKYKDENPGVALIAINLQEERSAAEKYWQEGNYTMLAVLDPAAELKAKYDIFTQPVTIFLNAKGEIVERRDGPISEEEFLSFASEIMQEAISAPLMEHSKEESTIRTSPTPDFLKRWSKKYESTVQHTVDFDEILSGGVPKDGIPAIDDPKFVNVHEAQTFLEPDDIGSIYMNGETIRFYPFRILNWHEIVNDTVEGQAIAVSYCPLCDSAGVYSRETSAGTSTFGVSGFLFQSNLVMYDRSTESLWNQIMGTAMAGELTGEELKLLPSNVIRFSTVQTEFPNTEVLSTKTGFVRDYSSDPYKGYADTEDIMFPVHTEDDRLSSKERILGIVVDGVPKAYPRSLLEQKTNFNDSVGEKNIAVSWNAETQTVAFLVEGERIEPVHAFWFSWIAQYPETEVFVTP